MKGLLRPRVRPPDPLYYLPVSRPSASVLAPYLAGPVVVAVRDACTRLSWLCYLHVEALFERLVVLVTV